MRQEKAQDKKAAGLGLAISHFEKKVGNSLFFTIGKLFGEKYHLSQNRIAHSARLQ